MDLIFSTILLLHGDLLKLVGDVVGGSAIDIPVRVDSVGTIGSRGNFFFVLRGVTIIIFVAVPTVLRRVAGLATNLAAREVRA